MPHHPHTFLSLITLSVALVITQAGCVALNIPSRRHHDPGDQGGLFGPWSQADGTTESVDLVVHAQGCPGGSCDSACGEPWGGCEWGCGIDEEVRPPEIPWPRFHPVPTRPIFGSPATSPRQ